MRLTAGLLFTAATVAACSSLPLDPFGRPYDEKNLLPKGPLRSCNAKSPIDVLPNLEFGSRPLYPIHSHILGRDGTARVTFRVGTDGTVTVDEYTTPDTVWFANHAAIAMRDWKVTPATSGGAPIEARCSLVFRYRIER